MKKAFTVKDKKLQFVPNLENYGEEYKKFDWNRAEEEFSDNWNIAYHIDKHKSNKVALYWEDEGKEKKFSFKELSLFSNKFANLLEKKGVKKGDRCFIFLPRIPELYFAFLGILKLGAVSTILFPAFGREGVSDRLRRAEAKVLITSSELVKRVDKKLVKETLVVDEKKFRQEFESEDDEFEIEKMKKDDAALMMFTSSTSGTPVEGIILKHGAIVQQYYTGKWVLDFKNDVYWCTADPGWITGVVYGIISPWLNGVSIVAYEGRFDADKWLELLEKYKVGVLYTAPTALRMLLKQGIKTKPRYLRHVCSVGEALNPETIIQAHERFGVIIHDTYWQTETGAMVICNFLSEDIKLGSMGKPVPGIKAEIVDDNGKILPAGKEGNIVLKPDFPGLMKGVWHRDDLYKSYFEHGWYVTGDRGYKDEDGYFFFIGRKDDIIKTSGERVSPFETESSLLEYPGVVEAAVVGKPDELRGAILVAFLVVKDKKKANEEEKENIKKFVKENLAGHAYPREIYFVDELPKNRSGKIVRMVLKQLLIGEKPAVASLVKPSVIEEIKKVIAKG